MTDDLHTDTILIYPDGSLQDTRRDSAWAAPIFSTNTKGITYRGFISGSVSHSIADDIDLSLIHI